MDYDDTFGLVGETAGRIVAVAHFYRNRTHPERAEAAFAVRTTCGGQGIGTRLLERLAESAVQGDRDFEADVLRRTAG